jgi:hypothetical protein
MADRHACNWVYSARLAQSFQLRPCDLVGMMSYPGGISSPGSPRDGRPLWSYDVERRAKALPASFFSGCLRRPPRDRFAPEALARILRSSRCGRRRPRRTLRTAMGKRKLAHEESRDFNTSNLGMETRETIELPRRTSRWRGNKGQ